MSVSPRVAGLLALTSLVPAAAFIYLNDEFIAAVTIVNILLITGSLAVALSPHEDDEAHADGA